MQNIERQLYVGFRRRDEWSPALVKALESIEAPLALPDEANRTAGNGERLATALSPLFYAQVVKWLEIDSGACRCRIGVLYDTFPPGEDDLDFSLLSMLDQTDDDLPLRVGVTDIEYAEYLFPGRLEVQRWGRFVGTPFTLAAGEPDTEERLHDPGGADSDGGNVDSSQPGDSRLKVDPPSQPVEQSHGDASSGHRMPSEPPSALPESDKSELQPKSRQSLMELDE